MGFVLDSIRFLLLDPVFTRVDRLTRLTTCRRAPGERLLSSVSVGSSKPYIQLGICIDPCVVRRFACTVGTTGTCIIINRVLLSSTKIPTEKSEEEGESRVIALPKILYAS